MNSIIICNTGTDSLTRIFLDSYRSERITFGLGEKPIGPHGIIRYDRGFITANNYSDSISFFDGITLKENYSSKIGAGPNDLVVYKDKAYVICGESNSVIVYDMIEDKVIYEIETGSWPHSIDYDDYRGVAFVSNLEGNNITVINVEENNVIKKIQTPEYPTKLLLSKDKSLIYVCESYLGNDSNGYLEIISSATFDTVKRIEVGSSPIDVFETGEHIYVSNFTDGTISVICRSNFELEKNIYVGGMPKGIIAFGNRLYVADYLKSKLYVLENENIKKVIGIETEPNAMTLF